LVGIPPEQDQTEEVESLLSFSPEILRQRLTSFFDQVQVTSLKSSPYGWTLPLQVRPQNATWKVYALFHNGHAMRLMVPQDDQKKPFIQKSLELQGLKTVPGLLHIKDNEYLLVLDEAKKSYKLSSMIPLTVMGGTLFDAKLVPESIDKVKRADDL